MALLNTSWVAVSRNTALLNSSWVAILTTQPNCLSTKSWNLLQNGICSAHFSASSDDLWNILHFRVLFFFSLRVLCDLRYIHNEPHLWSNPEGPIKPVRRQKIGIESLSTQVLTSTKRTNSFSVTIQAHSEYRACALLNSTWVAKVHY